MPPIPGVHLTKHAFQERIKVKLINLKARDPWWTCHLSQAKMVMRYRQHLGSTYNWGPLPCLSNASKQKKYSFFDKCWVMCNNISPCFLCIYCSTLGRNMSSRFHIPASLPVCKAAVPSMSGNPYHICPESPVVNRLLIPCQKMDRDYPEATHYASW